MKLYEIIEHLLRSNPGYIGENDEILKAKVSEAITNLDSYLVKMFKENETTRKVFFKQIDDIWVLNQEKLKWVVNSKEFLEDSYTSYTAEIGLTTGGNFLKSNTDIVLDFPYKDSVLVGGQNKDDQKREEIMYHEVLGYDQITNLKASKVLANAKRYTVNGFEENITFNEGDNLIIKGNNYSALNSLLTRYLGKVKLIYIDPPYNPRNSNNNTFKYNNRFNRATWLTFMKNRIEIAKKLLIPNEGVLIVAIDENEQAHLGVLLEEVFSEYEIHMITVEHNPRGVQGANFSYTNEFLYYIIPKGKKSIQNRKLEEYEIEESPLRNWGSESRREDAKNCFYPIIVKNNDIVGFGEVLPNDIHPHVNEKVNDFIYVYPIDSKGIERKWRYARNSVEGIKDLLTVKERKDGMIDIYLKKNFGQYKSVWYDKKYDSNNYGKQWLNKNVDDKSFSFPKSVYAVKDALYSVISLDKKAIVLDFFAGSGTTAEALSMINNEDAGERSFILVEQMDYIESITTERIKNTSLSKGIDSFIYCELLEDGQRLINKIKSATSDTIRDVKEEIFHSEQIVPYIQTSDLEKTDKIFDALSLEEQKQVLINLIDKNKLYVNYSSIDDEEYQVSEIDKKFSNSFYKGGGEDDE